MSKYRKKPIVIDAEPYKRGLEDGIEVHITDMNGVLLEPVTFTTEKVWERFEKFRTNYEKEFIIANIKPFIFTLEGKMYINSDDMIITGVKGERYPCKLDVFEMSYEKEDAKRYELEKNEMELLYYFARETNLFYLSSKFKDKFDKDTIEELDLLFSKIYKKYESDFR